MGRDQEDVATVAGEIERRYSADYGVGAWPDPDVALEELRRLQSNGNPVALVLSCPHGTDDGVEFLERVRELDGRTKRALLLRWGNFASRRHVSRTGRDAGTDPAATSASSLRGVFAAGDVRRGSTKRVASAVGEGAVVIDQVHQYLAQPSS